MSRRDLSGHESASNQYAVVLPCEPDYFRDFIAGLLGKPQTITKEIYGAFDLNKDDVANFFHLVVQRVSQQNESTLIQFTVTIVYDDDSTVLLNNFDDFIHYNEVRAIVSVAVHLSWTFLVKFQDKKVPERQQIDVSIFTETETSRVEHISNARHIIKSSRGNFSLRINHTARTWGADIEALLTGHIETLTKQVHPLRRYISRRYGWVGLIVGAITFLGSIAACFYSTSLLVDSRMKAIRTIQTPSEKADYLAELVASGVWPRFFFSILSFLVLALGVSVLIGVWTALKADNKEPSFLLLSKQAEKGKQKKLAAYERQWHVFVISIIGAIAIELIGNYLFTFYLERWITP